MSALGIGVSTQDHAYGWEAIAPTHHTRPISLSAQVWQLHGEEVDRGLEAGQLDYSEIEMLATLAADLYKIETGQVEECACVLPEQSCFACRTLLKATSILTDYRA